MAKPLQSLLRASVPLAYVFAFAVFLSGLAARVALLPQESRLAFATLYPGVVVVFYLAGAGPGLLYVALCAVSGLYVLRPSGWERNLDVQTLIALGCFLLSAVLIAYVVLRMQRASRRLDETRSHLQDLYDEAPCAYCSFDREGRFVEINGTGVGWFACPRDDLLGGRQFREFLSPESQVRFDANWPTLARTGRLGPLEYDVVGCDGSTRRVSVVSTAVRNSRGEFVRSRCLMFDITQMAQVRAQLQRANREQAVMLNNDLVGIVKLKDRRIVWKNPAVARMFGFRARELEGQSTRSLYFDDATHIEVGRRAYEKLRRGETFREQLLMKRKDGTPIWVDVSGAMLSQEESLWMLLDITPMREYQEQIERLATYDALTGLPNRKLFADRLEQALASANRHQEQLAVCFLDLDGFKAVNDTRGHPAGDFLLSSVAKRMAATLRHADTVARVGGDEFAIVLIQIKDKGECLRLLERVLERINEPTTLEDGALAFVGASIGVAVLPADGACADELVRKADAAMYRAKSEGRNRIYFYE